MDTTCKACGKPIKRKPREIKPDGNYCSKECWYSSGASRPNRKTGTYKTCEVCGNEFYAQISHSEQKYCGRECKGIASRLSIKPCAVCQKDFKPPFGRPEQPCCSRECGRIYRTANVTAQRTGYAVPCKVCGKDVYVTESITKGRANFYCSSEHRKEWVKQNKTIHICKICGKEFKHSPSRTKSGKYNVTYCSLACRDADPERREMLLAMTAKQQRMTPNKIERIGYQLLDDLEVEYLPQHLIGGKFCVDAFIPSLNIVVQFDGDYWHYNPALFPTPDTRQQKRMRLDKSQDAYMQVCGYSVVRIWASDLEKHLEQVKMRLQALLTPSSHNPVAQE